MPTLPTPPYDRIPLYITSFQSSPVNTYRFRDSYKYEYVCDFHYNYSTGNSVVRK